jgi:uncharacterized membrane protein
MTKFLLLLLIIVVLAIIGVSVIFKSIKRIFTPFIPQDQINKDQTRKKKYDNVIYDKDDVVVLKGEAKDKDKDTKKKFYNNSDD